MIINNLPIFNNNLTLIMKVFNKYLVTGKDIIIIDNRKYVFNPEESDLINKLYVNKF